MKPSDSDDGRAYMTEGNYLVMSDGSRCICCTCVPHGLHDPERPREFLRSPARTKQCRVGELVDLINSRRAETMQTEHQKRDDERNLPYDTPSKE